MLSLLFCVTALHGPREAHVILPFFLSWLPSSWIRSVKRVKTKRYLNWVKKKTVTCPSKQSVLHNLTVSLASVPLLQPPHSSIKLSLSKLGELVTPVLNPSTLPQLNHPSSPAFHRLSISFPHTCYFSIYPLVAQVWHLLLTSKLGTPALAAVLPHHRHIKRPRAHFIYSRLLFPTHERKHTHFSGNHPHFPIYHLVSAPPFAISMCDPALLHFPPASR